MDPPAWAGQTTSLTLAKAAAETRPFSRGTALLLLPLSPEISVASSRLPGKFHGDPADRILAASARLHDLSIVTHDERILAYGAERYVSVLNR